MTFAIEPDNGDKEALLDATILDYNMDTWNTDLKHCASWSDAKWRNLQLIPRTYSGCIANRSYGAGEVLRSLDDKKLIKLRSTNIGSILSLASIAVPILILTLLSYSL